jgi:outer membrane beta-barrel protein
MKNNYSFILIIILFLGNSAFGANSAQQPTASSPDSNTEDAEVEEKDINAIKKAYWKDTASSLNVIQSRTFSKAGRFKLEADFGTMIHDPFLTTTYVGGAVGYNFNEYVALNALFWKAFETKSAAVSALQAAELKAGGSLFNVNTNPIYWLAGGEFGFSLLYGKLSVVGKAIVHFDVMLLAGGGLLVTQNAKLPAGWLGVSQQFYIARFLALKLDYHCMIYYEPLIEQNNVETKGTLLERRFTFSQNFSVSLVLM